MLKMFHLIPLNPKVFIPITVSGVEFVLFFPVTLLMAIHVYSPLMLKDKRLVAYTDVLDTIDPLNHQQNWLSGSDMAEQLKTA